MFQIYCLISSHRGQKWKIHDKLKKKLITKQQTRDDISLYCFKKFIKKYLFLHSKYKLSKKYADNNCFNRVDNFNLSNVVYIFLYSSHFDAQSINNFTNSKRFEFLFFVFNWFHCLFVFHTIFNHFFNVENIETSHPAYFVKGKTNTDVLFHMICLIDDTHIPT